jgi:NSS family neurotransmitter:Na+ symporter
MHRSWRSGPAEVAAPEGSTAPGGEAWSSRSGFVLATIGSAIGIGSIWKFPYEVGANGGGAFVLVYVAGLALVVVPLMLAEFALGRRGRGDAATSIDTVARAEGVSPRWRLVGGLGALTAFLILSYYSVIGGWTLIYTLDTTVSGLPAGDGSAVTDRYADMLDSPLRMALFHALFLGAVLLVVRRGVQRGIEAAMKILMPVLMVLLVVLATYSMATGDAGETLRFLFVPDLDHFGPRAVLDALGLGFFSIGVGLGLLVTYAAYSPPGVDLRTVAFSSVGADTAVSFAAGFAVFPIVFANGLDPASGPGLVFVSLPRAFASMPFGRAAAVVFFALLAIAALGSAISMLEGVVAVWGHLFGVSRARTAPVAAALCYVVGLATVLSFNHWSGFHPLGAVPRYADATVFDLLDELTSNILLPLGGLLVAVLCAWVLSPRLLADELELHGVRLAALRLVLKVVAPAAIIAASVASLVG